MVERKIKDIFGCKYIEASGELYPLQKWYNQLIDKKVSEINVADVIRMIHQKEFMEVAISKAIVLLKNNPFVGDRYEGELLKKVFELDIEHLKCYITDIIEILLQATRQNATYEWLIEEERLEFESMIKKFSVKISDFCRNA